MCTHKIGLYTRSRHTKYQVTYKRKMCLHVYTCMYIKYNIQYNIQLSYIILHNTQYVIKYNVQYTV